MERGPGAADGAALARLAAGSVRARAGGARVPAPPVGPPPDSATLRADGACFVTLTRASGELRGCIGTLVPYRPLYVDAVGNAHRAAADPRLTPVTAAELPGLSVCVCVLGPLEVLPVVSVDGLLAALHPGVDGLAISDGWRQATFLPAVWHKLPDPDRFLAALLAKGGWPGWTPGLAARRYTTQEYRQPVAG